MKIKMLFVLILVLGGAFLVNGCANKSPIYPESCNWKPGDCDMIIGSGYYYNTETKECGFFPGGSGCSEPPFKTLEECKSLCEKK